MWRSAAAIVSAAAASAELGPEETLAPSAAGEDCVRDPLVTPPPPVGTTSMYSLGAELDGRGGGEPASAEPAPTSATAATSPATTHRLVDSIAIGFSHRRPAAPDRS
jgi:hypothetical protein